MEVTNSTRSGSDMPANIWARRNFSSLSDIYSDNVFSLKVAWQSVANDRTTGTGNQTCHSGLGHTSEEAL